MIRDNPRLILKRGVRLHLYLLLSSIYNVRAEVSEIVKALNLIWLVPYLMLQHERQVKSEKTTHNLIILPSPPFTP